MNALEARYIVSSARNASQCVESGNLIEAAYWLGSATEKAIRYGAIKQRELGEESSEWIANEIARILDGVAENYPGDPAPF